MAGLHASSIGCPTTTNTDERSARPEFDEIRDRMLVNPDFVAALDSLILSMEGPMKWHSEALTTFGQMMKVYASRAEDQIERERAGE